jgi:hypothetical protein
MSYETKNTAVAAALVTLGRHVTGMSQHNGSVLWELDSGEIDGEPDGVARAFQTRNYSREPLASIVRAANAREWLLDNVVHGQYEMEAEPDSFITQSISLAIILVAENHYLRAFRGRDFYFAPGAKLLAGKLNGVSKDCDTLDYQRRFLGEFCGLLNRAREAMLCQSA